MNKRNAIELILGVLLIVCSVFVFNRPVVAFIALGYLIGIAAIVKGVHFIYLYFKVKNIVLFKANTFLVFGILLSLIGIVFIIKPMFANSVFAYILAIWFIFDAVNNFLSLGILRDLNIGLYIIGILANVILLIGGICIIINPWVAAISLSFVIGVTFLVSGIEYIIFAITGRNDKRRQGLSFRNLH